MMSNHVQRATAGERNKNCQALAVRVLRNERGVALIVALVMLVVLTILGTWVLSTSSVELQISGNYRTASEAFYAAAAAVDYAETNAGIYSAIVLDSASASRVWPLAGAGNGAYPNNNAVPQMPAGSSADVRVEYVARGPLPPGSGYDADVAAGYEALYFAVRTTGWGRNNSRSDIEAQVARIVAK